VRRRAGDKPARQRGKETRPAPDANQEIKAVLINFTDHRGNEQITAQLVAVRTAFRDCAEDIETANVKLRAAIEDIVESLDCAYSLFEDCEQDPKNADRISVSMRSLEALKREQEEAEAAIAAIFQDHGWDLRRAMRAFKEAIAREAAP
jgi:hypothetical protein